MKDNFLSVLNLIEISEHVVFTLYVQSIKSIVLEIFNSVKSNRVLLSGWQKLGDRGTGGPQQVRVFYDRKEPQHTLFCRVFCLGIVAIYALFERLS